MGDRFTSKTFDLLPRYFRFTDTYGDLEKLCASFDLEFQRWNVLLDKLSNVWRSDRVDDDNVEIVAYNVGVPVLQYLSIEATRRFVQQGPRLYKRKGSLDTIVDALRVVLEISSTITSVWNRPDLFTIGISEIGDENSIGPLYRAEDPRSFIVGESTIGTTLIGSTLLNERVPRTFRVVLTIVPTEDQLKAIRFIIDLFKAAEEHYDIVWPNVTSLWILDKSKLDLDTVLAGSGWVVGESIIGITNFINGPATAIPIDPVVIADPVPLFNLYWTPTFGEVPIEPIVVL
jgi:hypothetical protein